MKRIWTIGHSTHPLEEFISMLKSFEIKVLADIRSFPGSRRYPHFNKEPLAKSLANEHILYCHFPDLGGRRKPKPDSINIAWRHASFRGYADYMETESFKIAIEELEKIALEKKTAYVCSEALWWKCHRSLVSDYLKSKGWRVEHIMTIGKSEEHSYTSPVSIKQGELFYS